MRLMTELVPKWLRIYNDIHTYTVGPRIARHRLYFVFSFSTSGYHTHTDLDQCLSQMPITRLSQVPITRLSQVPITRLSQVQITRLSQV